MKAKSLVVGLVVVLALMGLGVDGRAEAFTLHNPELLELTCTGWIDNGLTMDFLRDNTGTGAEAYYVEAFDGYGNQLHYFSAALWGTGWVAGSGLWATPPQANPLTLRLVSLAGNGYTSQTYTWTGNCDGLPMGAPTSPTHPPDFEQHDIICDSPVYDAPGGSPVGEDMVYAGQDWHVSPVPEMGPDGQNWTQIFVGGEFLGYIPTACVGGVTPWN
jgi:hypothetical protein